MLEVVKRVPSAARALLARIDMHLATHRRFPTPSELCDKDTMKGSVQRNLTVLEEAGFILRQARPHWDSAERQVKDLPDPKLLEKVARVPKEAKRPVIREPRVKLPKPVRPPKHPLTPKHRLALFYINQVVAQGKPFPSPVVVTELMGKKASSWSRAHTINCFKKLESLGFIARSEIKQGRGGSWSKQGLLTEAGLAMAKTIPAPEVTGVPVVFAGRTGGGIAEDGGTKFKDMLFPADMLELGDLIQRPDPFGKLGARVTKARSTGRQMGLTIKTWSLEEGVTCSPTCGLREVCFAGKMATHKRILYEGPKTDQAVAKAISQMGRHHYRINTVGDIPTESFLVAILAAITVTASTAFGYTHWQPESYLGGMISYYADIYWEFFAIRTSYEHGSREPLSDRGAVVVENFDPVVLAEHNAIACPQQEGKAKNCASCGLCWTTRQNIAFKLH